MFRSTVKDLITQAAALKMTKVSSSLFLGKKKKNYMENLTALCTGSSYYIKDS